MEVGRVQLEQRARRERDREKPAAERELPRPRALTLSHRTAREREMRRYREDERGEAAEIDAVEAGARVRRCDRYPGVSDRQHPDTDTEHAIGHRGPHRKRRRLQG